MLARHFERAVNTHSKHVQKSACQLFGEAAVPTLEEMTRHGVPDKGMYFNRIRDGPTAVALFTQACDAAFVESDTPDGWPPAGEARLLFTTRLEFAREQASRMQGTLQV